MLFTDGPPLPTSPPPNVGAIVGGVFGGLLVVLIVVGAAVYYRKYGTPQMPVMMRRKTVNRDFLFSFWNFAYDVT